VKDLWIVRGVFLCAFILLSYYLRPFALGLISSLLFGAAVGVAIVLFEIRLRRVTLTRLIGAAVGSVLGILGAFMMSLVLGSSLGSDTVSFLKIGLLMLMGYVGLVVGGAQGDMLNLSALGGLFGGDKSSKKSYKLLDTSVIIDGRIADVAETGFLDGIFVVPQFVLWELQLVADSADSLKRNRGRRGLDVLQRVQKMANLDVQIIEADYPKVKDVDLKLIQLARDMDAKIVTNDFNLNKLAQLQGVTVLNINELANALKPIVLPGETMKVFILKEGKEYNQGVAYLDDGTMVVVDNARRYISKTIEISVTSVLQTTAGKMIFGRYDEKTQPAPEKPAPVHKGSSGHPSPQRVEQPAGR
jgi:uncharacterized protein YacL